MQKNLKCPVCGANAFHLDKREDGMYVLKCMTKEKCGYEFESNDSSLERLS